MRKGKIAAQVAHASMQVLLNEMGKTDQSDIGYTRALRVLNTDPLAIWLDNSFTKIVVSCQSADELIELHKQAVSNRIRTSLIVDNGNTEFHGVPTLTCCAVGPGFVEEIDKLTGHFKLL